jgi:hypothetical protein
MGAQRARREYRPVRFVRTRRVVTLPCDGHTHESAGCARASGQRQSGTSSVDTGSCDVRHIKTCRSVIAAGLGGHYNLTRMRASRESSRVDRREAVLLVVAVLLSMALPVVCAAMDCGMPRCHAGQREASEISQGGGCCCGSCVVGTIPSSDAITASAKTAENRSSRVSLIPTILADSVSMPASDSSRGLRGTLPPTASPSATHLRTTVLLI